MYNPHTVSVHNVLTLALNIANLIISVQCKVSLLYILQLTTAYLKYFTIFSVLHAILFCVIKC